MSGDGPFGRTGPAEFTVLLGPDYAGKSSVLGHLARNTDITVVSYDSGLVGPGYPLVDRLRDDFLGEALRGIGKRYSPDVLLTVLQVAVVHLRDRVLEAPAGRPVIVDSYYYKILAKCLLSGFVNESMFSWWRSFPRPRAVAYLETDPATAWSRSGEGAQVNGFECYRDHDRRTGFLNFQRDMQRLMLHEARDVPLYAVPQCDGVHEVVDRVERIIRRGHGPECTAAPTHRAVSAAGAR